MSAAPLDLVIADLGVLDLVFVDLEALPGPGQERFARDFVRTTGGGATMAVAAARLGLRAGLLPPLGDDEEGRLLRTLLEREAVALLAAPAGRTSVTAIMPVDGERAMATFEPPGGARPDLAGPPPRAALVSIDDLEGWPAPTWRYVTVGDREAMRYRGALPPALRGARALFANEAEAIALSGERSALDAARALSRDVATVVVSRGPAGALVVCAERELAEPTPAVEVVNTTGAGDLFATAWAWADLNDASLEDRLRWALLYASASVSWPTALEGAQSLPALLAAGCVAGLAPPPAIRAG